MDKQGLGVQNEEGDSCPNSEGPPVEITLHAGTMSPDVVTLTTIEAYDANGALKPEEELARIARRKLDKHDTRADITARYYDNMRELRKRLQKNGIIPESQPQQPPVFAAGLMD